MSRRPGWSALLALAFVMGLMAWLAPTAHGESARKPATIRSVSPSGTDAPDCSGPPCKHIQYAIDQSSYGDRINVASGIYTEHITMTNGVSVYGTAARVANNTVANNSAEGILFSSANGIQLFNNIVFSNTYGIVRADGSTHTVDYNDVYSNTVNYSGVLTGTHDLSMNPLFLGTGNLLTYYHLQATSPVSKTGSLAYAPPFDIDWDRRGACTSMGADQICSKSLYLPLILK